jgi:hypothetical protein
MDFEFREESDDLFLLLVGVFEYFLDAHESSFKFVLLV